MADVNYKDIDDKISEELIDENIPRDLMKLYRVQPYESQRNPDTRHAELFSNERRFKLYDYGKAQYRVISPDEAIRMVKNNKQEVQNLRIIYNGELVEYELRDNGSIYAIYRSPREMELNGKEYKNVGYAPWRQVIEAADKIYWTDEYSRKLSPEDIAKRQEKETDRIIYKGVHPGDSSYDPHKPNSNLMGGETIRLKALPDTGTHSYSIKKEKYKAYDLARKALKKLEAEKEFYDEEEYTQLHIKFSALKQDALNAYNLEIRTDLIKHPKKIKEISAQTDAFNRKLLEYTRVVENALTRSFDLKKRLDKLLTTTANNTSDTRVSGDIESLRGVLNDVVADLRNDTRLLDDAEQDVKDATEQVVKETLDDLEQTKKRYIDKHLTSLAEIEQSMKEVEDSLAPYQPHTTARKARIAAEQTKELSPELLNVIEFDDF